MGLGFVDVDVAGMHKVLTASLAKFGNLSEFLFHHSMGPSSFGILFEENNLEISQQIVCESLDESLDEAELNAMSTRVLKAGLESGL